jgi:hypothetical protein
VLDPVLDPVPAGSLVLCLLMFFNCSPTRVLLSHWGKFFNFFPGGVPQ